MSEYENADEFPLLGEAKVLDKLSLEDRLLVEAIACTGWPLSEKLAFLAVHDNRELVYQAAGFHRKLDAVLPNNSMLLRRRGR